MTPDTPIYGKEGEELERKISQWVRDEVIDSGNQSLVSMFVIAIEKMAEYIEDHQDDEDTDVSKLQSRIYSLESENRKLKMRLENIAKVVNS